LAGVLITGTALAQPVPPAYQQVAREYAVPADILFAIALTESGRKHADGRFLPYPWAMNLSGTAFYFATRAEAEAKLAQWLAAGHAPDIGLMQVNWRYHQRRLGDLSQAFDPWLNLRTGANVLRDAYRSTGDWWRAVGRYHSATPARAEAYRERVRRWHRRIG
jgi:soluble lytic murein transglycosylase-like protein